MEEGCCLLAAGWMIITCYVCYLWPLVNVVEWWCWYNSIASWLNPTDTDIPHESVFQSSPWAAIAQLFLPHYWQQNASSGWYQAFCCICCLGTNLQVPICNQSPSPPNQFLNTHNDQISKQFWVLVAMATVNDSWKFLIAFVGGVWSCQWTLRAINLLE